VTNPFWPPYTPDVFGPLVSTGDVRDAVKSTLQLWTPGYIAEIAERKAITLPPFEDWTVRPEYRSLPTTAAPACMVTCPGTLKQPERQGGGEYIAYFGVQVSVVVWGADWEPTEDTTGYYSTAVVASLLQHPSLGDFAEGVEWLGTRYGEVEHSSTRTLGAAQINFSVAVNNVVNASAGPASPTAPGPLPPTVESASVTVTALEDQ
jgi:hypothetical protein